MKERNYALDLYRLLCMFLITTIHITGYSGLPAATAWTHPNFYLVRFLSVLQLFAISGFTMISAYFLVDSTSTGKKLISFELQLLFYSVTVFLLSLLFSGNVTKQGLLNSFFPVLTYHYWYPVNYMILLLWTPLLNKAIRAFGRNELLTAILVIAAAVSVFFPLNPYYDPNVFVGNTSHSLLWFVLLYLIAAYLKRYGVRKPRLFGWGMFLCSGAVLFLLQLLQGDIFGLYRAYPFLQKVLERIDLLSSTSLLSLLLTVSSFLIFSNMRLSLSKTPAKIAAVLVPSLFAVYLLQEHIAVREQLWRFVDIVRWADSFLLLPIMLLVFAGLLAGAVLLHLLYRLACMLFLHKLEQVLGKALETILQLFKKTVFLP